MTENEIAALAVMLRLDPSARRRVLTCLHAVVELQEEEAFVVSEETEAFVDPPLPPAEPEKILIEDLEISTRSYNALNKAGIKTVGQLVEKRKDDLSRIRSLGAASLHEIQELLKGMGLRLAS